MRKVKKNYADMDPIEEIRVIREELSREFPTVKALCEHVRANYPVANSPPAEPRRKGWRASMKTNVNARPAMRRRKSAAHA